MGRINEFTCSSCNTTWQVRLGHGLGHAMLESVLEEFSEENQQKILEDTEGEEFPSFEFQFRTAICQRCKNVVAVPVITLLQSGQTYFNGCPDCGNSVIIPEQGSEMSCPNCGKAALTEEEIGRWD